MIVAGVVVRAVVAAMAPGAGAMATPIVSAVTRGVDADSAPAAVVARIVIRAVTRGAAVIVPSIVPRRIVSAVARLCHTRGPEGAERQR